MHILLTGAAGFIGLSPASTTSTTTTTPHSSTHGWPCCNTSPVFTSRRWTWPTAPAWSACLPASASMPSSTWPRRPVCATPSPTRTPTWRATSPALATCSKAAARRAWATGDAVDHPVSLYAATKKANELMAHTYSHLYRLPTTGLRFFTVYGPWGRPDMAYFSFTKAVLEGRPIDVFNHGNMKRDFTYIDDIVEGVVRVLDKPATPEAAGAAPYRVFNIGNHDPVPLLDFIACIEQATGRSATKNLLPMQPGDVPATYASTEALRDWVGFAPSTPLAEGIGRFVRWYREYHRV